MNTRDAPRDPAVWAAELREQADDYDRFAGRVGAVLGPEYVALAAELRRRAERLLNPHAEPQEPPVDLAAPPSPDPLQPQSREQALAAWQAVLRLVTARRSGLDTDGANLLEVDPRHVVWAAVAGLSVLLDACDPSAAQAIMEGWGLNAAVASHG
jgi:hypothetical protein